MQLEGFPTPWVRGVEGGKDVPRLGSRGHLPGPGNTAERGPKGQGWSSEGTTAVVWETTQRREGGGEQYPGFPLQSLPRASLPIEYIS